MWFFSESSMKSDRNSTTEKSGHKTARAAVVELTPPFMVLMIQTNVHQALRKFETLPQAVSFTDCLVMATADEYETRDIFGFDKQFQDAGYNRLEPSTEWD
jgi:predicted nucleic acid-binding protein